MPTNQNSNLEAEIEAVREIYAALNRNDIPAVLKFFDSQIERIEFEGLPFAGRFRGYEEVKAHFSGGRENWAEGSCQPEGLLPPVIKS
jgi:hypothetical protein